MKINFEKEDEISIKVKATDIVTIKSDWSESTYMVVPWVEIGSAPIKYAFVAIDAAEPQHIGRTWNWHFDSLEELNKSIEGDIEKHYSSDEYELLLQKKKKC